MLTEEEFLTLSAHEVQVYGYFRYQSKSRTNYLTPNTPPLKKTFVAKMLKMSRSKLDACLKRLVEFKYISIVSEPRKPLIIQFPNPFEKFFQPWR